MANFQLVVNKVLNFEGGYQCDPADSGNYNSKGELIGTKYGIAAQTLETYLRRPVTKSDMQNLTQEAAIKMMKSMFWDVVKGDQINNQSIAEQIFDWFWGSGYTGIRETQEAIADILGADHIKVDFKFTTSEIDYINQYPDQARLFTEIKQARIDFINRIVLRSVANYQKKYFDKNGTYPNTDEIKQHTYSRFLKGWLKRVNSFYFEP